VVGALTLVLAAAGLLHHHHVSDALLLARRLELLLGGLCILRSSVQEDALGGGHLAPRGLDEDVPGGGAIRVGDLGLALALALGLGGLLHLATVLLNHLLAHGHPLLRLLGRGALEDLREGRERVERSHLVLELVQAGGELRSEHCVLLACFFIGGLVLMGHPALQFLFWIDSNLDIF